MFKTITGFTYRGTSCLAVAFSEGGTPHKFSPPRRRDLRHAGRTPIGAADAPPRSFLALGHGAADLVVRRKKLLDIKSIFDTIYGLEVIK